MNTKINCGVQGKMDIIIEYSGQLRQSLGLQSERVELGTARTVQELVREPAARHATHFRQFILEADGVWRTALLLAVNDVQVRWETPHELREGDTVRVIAPIAGG